ncbi:MAG TPA: hypothetical protein GX018_08325 [Bacteroidales bacterium]|nr:hypothetical protein [Bacteroidales bacterium]
MNKCMLLLTLLLPISFLYAQKLVDTGGRGYGQTSVNTAIFRTNSLVSHQNSQYIAFYDEERHSRVSLAKKNIGTKSDWEVIDLAGFTVDAWEPSFDTELWKEKQKLHIYVQRSSQGDGEKSTDLEPQPVYVLEVE